MDIHNYDYKYKKSFENLQKAKISDQNKKLILDCVNAFVLRNLSKSCLMRYMGVLKNIAIDMKKDLDKATIEDVKTCVAKIQQNSKYSPWTKQTYKVMIRRFYQWQKCTKNYPEIVDWININIAKNEMQLPSEGDLLTELEVQKLLNAAEHPRDKAFLAALWESGTRIGELGTLCMKHIVFDKYGTVITVKGIGIYFIHFL